MHEAPKQVRTLELMNLLLLHFPLRECAKRMNVSVQTARKWAKDKRFLDDLRDKSESIYSEVLKDLETEIKSIAEQINDKSDKALSVLEEIMCDTAVNAAVRAKAADSILDRNPDAARNKKISGEFDNRHTIDPELLRHAAQTAAELDKASFERDGSRE